MKKLFAMLTVMAVMLGISAIAGDESPWFDMENCSMCKNLLAEKGLMENVTWENHLISDGAMIVVTIAPDFMDVYKKVNENMMAIGAKLEKGEQMYLCGGCQAYGVLMMAGANFEYVQTMHGDVTLITSDKPELVEKIKKYGQRNIDEMAKMMDMDKGHEGHGHDSHEGHGH